MGSLQESYEKTLLDTKYGDKGSVHSYIEVYEKYVSRFKQEANVLELGVGYGESLRMWEDYFNSGYVVGVQLPNPNQKFKDIVKQYELNIIYSDATASSLYDILSDLKFDIVIDDASHKINDQLISFRNLHKLVSKGGLYIIEDIEDIDSTRLLFEELHPSCKIYDMRKQKNRFDNVMVVYEF